MPGPDNGQHLTHTRGRGLPRLDRALLGLGLGLLLYAGLDYLELVPGSSTSLPEPVALSSPRPLGASVAATPVGSTVRPTVVEWPTATRAPEVAPLGTPGPAIAEDRPLETVVAVSPSEAVELPPAPPQPGYAAHLTIPSIKIDTDVRQGGLKQNKQGVWEWETLPFVAVHYGDATALVGSRSNAVIAGHVATLNEGNVFASLYRVALGDEIQVSDTNGDLHLFRVADVKLVDPSETSIMQPTSEPVLTLITCGGRFDPIRREFSKRLVVVATPVDPVPEMLLDAHFEAPQVEWPTPAEGTAAFGDGVYRLWARTPAHFVAVGAPLAPPAGNTSLSARFRKLGGPPGGGYGLVVRDQAPAERNGVNQAGRFYVLEVGDRGQIGIWRREAERWVDLLSWTMSPAVRPGSEENELTAVDEGQQITFFVNGVEVARLTDAVLPAGSVGLFVGGDGNEVGVESFSVQAP